MTDTNEPDPAAIARSEAARALGSVRSARKAETSRQNLERAHDAHTPAECTCGQLPHKYWCVVAKRAYSQAYRDRKAAAAKGGG
jgi:hypothetical protein